MGVKIGEVRAGGDQSHTLPLPLPSRERKENRGVQATENPDEPK